MTASLRRGWCPGALKPMETGDGWLVRLHPPLGLLTPAMLRSIAGLAAQHGNGLADITARGNLQLRGIRPASHRPLVETLLETGLVDPDEDHGPHRLVLTSALAGCDPTEHADPRPLVAAITAACRGLALPAKTVVVVDGGGLPLTAQNADLTLRAIAPDAWLIGLPNDQWTGPLTSLEAPKTVRDLLTRLTHQGERPARVTAEMVAEARHALRLAAHPAPPERPKPLPTGLFAEKGGTSAALAVAPFGRLDATTLAALAGLASEAGACDIRLTAFRGVALTGLADAPAALDRLARLGLIATDGDPRLAVAACPGAPACSRGEAPAQQDAALIAAAAAARLGQGLTLHVSGCAKGCAHPRRADLTLVGRAGAYDIVLDGTAASSPVARLGAQDLALRVAAPGALATFLTRELP